MTPEDKLNHPAWYSLSEKHSHFSLGNDFVKRYQPHIAPFVACHPGMAEAFGKLDEYSSSGEPFFMIGDLVHLPSNYEVLSQLLCVQMICASVVTIPATDVIISLDENDATTMADLINLVQPGYYLPGTRLLGNYIGIRVNGRLVAMCGERMGFNGYTEISGVVTHPDFTGRRFARQLVAHLTKQNSDAGKVAFLHAAATNQRAIGLYQHLGYGLRRTINFSRIIRV